jgi:two-component system response regulator (stage 0 sporulation protein F)
MKKILIIDDQPCIRELISEELSVEGYGTYGIGHAELAWKHLRFSQPDLVLLDLYLDGPEGFEVLGEIKRHYPHLPVIILTAYDTFFDDPRLSQADGYVLKSMYFNKLKEEIARVFTQQQAFQVSDDTKPFCPETPVTCGVSSYDKYMSNL